MTVEAIGAANAVSASDPVITSLGQSAEQIPKAPESSFANVLDSMIGDVENKVSEANELVREFAVDNSVPVHKVTFALEEARLSVEMMVQVRSRLVEGYREIMNMQM